MVMNLRTALCGVFFLSLPAMSALSAEDVLETGSIKIEPRLELECFHHIVSDHWTLSQDRTDNFYSYSSTTTTNHSWGTVFGQSLFLDLSLRPFNPVRMSLGFELVNDYADRYWRPHNREHQYDLDGRKFAWNTADIDYRFGWGDLRYVRGNGRIDWTYEGDLFGHFPETAIPQMFEAVAKGAWGKLDVVYGMDDDWKYTNTHPQIGIYGANTYLNYNVKLGGGKYHALAKSEKSIYDPTGERLYTYELTGDYDVQDNPLQVGLLYRPYRLGWDYEYVENAPAGQGESGSNYVRRTGKTKTLDAFGAGAKIVFSDVTSFIDQLTLKYTYEGLVAGNKHEASGEIMRRFARPLTASINYTYRKPLLGPIPLTYEGTAANPGPALFEPRGAASPFWVNWDNREMGAATMVLTFDPTPQTWFYRFRPNVVEEWNLNPDEDARFSCAVRYSLTRYYTGTDRLVYWKPTDTAADPWWEGYGAGGAWATNDYLGAFKLLAVMQSPRTKTRCVFDLEMGESLAGASAAYTLSTAQAKPITGYLITGLSIDKKPYKAMVKYYKDYWGPEYWHQTFGEVSDAVYQAQLSRAFGENVTVGMEYVVVRERDDKYVAPELGDYDEVRCFATIKFGPIIGRFGSGLPAAGADMPDADVLAPQVSLGVSTTSFTPDGSGPISKLVMEPWAADLNGVARWEISITAANGMIVKKFDGKGQPPYRVQWDGKDDVYGSVVKTGTYALQLTAKDEAGNTAMTEPIPVDVVTYPVEPVVKEPVREVKVTEMSRGLLVSLTSNVLFDTGKFQLKPAASKSLNQVLHILSAYPENNIAVEGHTDSVGGDAMNQKLSEKRAESVATYLIAGGVAKERVSTAGFGKTKPVASNATVKGREANRRVEVIILKK